MRRDLPLDDFAVRCWPASSFGDWLDALGFPVLAYRARAVLAQETMLGRQFAALIADHTIRFIDVDWPAPLPAAG